MQWGGRHEDNSRSARALRNMFTALDITMHAGVIIAHCTLQKMQVSAPPAGAPEAACLQVYLLWEGICSKPAYPPLSPFLPTTT